MTESEWLACEEPARMLMWLMAHYCDAASNRKLAMVSLAFDRINDKWNDYHARVEEMLDAGGLPHPWDQCKSMAVGCAMACTDGRDNGKAGADAIRDIIGSPFRPVHWSDDPKVHAEPAPRKSPHPSTVPHVEMRRAWLSSTVLSLATPAYEYRRAVGVRFACNESGKHSHRGLAGTMAHGVFHATNPNVLHHHHDDKCPRVIETDGTLDPLRLSVLADALEESGCDNADILGHIRSPGPHWRGCWVVDLLLNKE